MKRLFLVIKYYLSHKYTKYLFSSLFYLFVIVYTFKIVSSFSESLFSTGVFQPELPPLSRSLDYLFDLFSRLGYVPTFFLRHPISLIIIGVLTILYLNKNKFLIVIFLLAISSHFYINTFSYETIPQEWEELETRIYIEKAENLTFSSLESEMYYYLDDKLEYNISLRFHPKKSNTTSWIVITPPKSANFSKVNINGMNGKTLYDNASSSSPPPDFVLQDFLMDSYSNTIDMTFIFQGVKPNRPISIFLYGREGSKPHIERATYEISFSRLLYDCAEPCIRDFTNSMNYSGRAILSEGYLSNNLSYPKATYVLFGNDMENIHFIPRPSKRGVGILREMLLAAMMGLVIVLVELLLHDQRQEKSLSRVTNVVSYIKRKLGLFHSSNDNDCNDDF